MTGNVFGREIEGSIPVKMLTSDVEALLKTTGKGGQILLNVDGQNYNVLIKEIAYNALKHQTMEASIDVQLRTSEHRSMYTTYV